MAGLVLRGAHAAVLALFALSVGTLPALAAAQAPGEQPDAVAQPASIDAALQRLDKRLFDLSRALESARVDLSSAERRFSAAQERLDLAIEPEDVLTEEVAARRLQLSVGQRVVALLEEQLARVRREQQTWSRRDALDSRRVEPGTIAEWTLDCERSLEEVAREISVKRSRTEELRQELALLQERQQRLAPGSGLERWLGLESREYQRLLEQYEQDLAGLESEQGLQRELAAALQRAHEDLPLTAKLTALAHRLREIWNYEITASETEPITPGKIISAIAIFLIGYSLAAAVARVLGRRVFPRMRLEEGAAAAFQSLVFYLLLLVAFLTALRMVQIPLTAFAVLGGALAIGVGFGSQNVVNNFISGLILLAERPIKLGDLIELEGVYGTVERIGLRSTRVRTGDNIHIIVPNASFLESNVTNWTHTDARVRITVAIGLVYGAPTREAERLVRRVLEEHEAVLRDPEPAVLFRDFGDNALIFEARFWIEMRTMMDRLKVESDIRFRIDDLFREAGIVIAFPQRDVHLDTASPLEVRVVGKGVQGAGEA
ncbi:MAG TPA: mechanosensitive ion channel domain-containing protein [Myxococcota bacterium]